MILPIYKALNVIDQYFSYSIFFKSNQALVFFNQYKNFYHPIAVNSINNILNGNGLTIQ